MNVLFDHDRCTLLQGDCGELDLPVNSVDAIVTDPPAGIGFMGREWDGDKGGRDAWSAWLAGALAPSVRALKPGGHALVWALPRTSHWTAAAIELSGLEIRDVHHDICSMDEPLRAFVASLDDQQRAALVRVLEAQSSPILYHLFGTGFPKSLTSKSADIPEGTGTALKPAVEHWILARKPLDGTVAENYAKYGTGVLSIDACRITHASDADRASATPQGRATSGNHALPNVDGNSRKEFTRPDTSLGRWPAHLSLDEPAASELDAQSGELTSGAMTAGGDRSKLVCYGQPSGPRFARDVPPSKGGASRFFYVAKAPRSEKDAGLDHLQSKSGGEATGRQDDSAGTRNPRAGAGRTGGARNHHPTVKSIALMEWLIKLICPPEGTVLDPFAGSGTTGIAALGLGMDFVGCELGGGDGEYLPILLGRIRHALGITAQAPTL